MHNDTKNLVFFLILFKIIFTFFFLNIYVNFSSIGDARGYLKRIIDFNQIQHFLNIFTNRTHFVETLYAISNTFFSKHLTPYLFSILSILIIWNSLKSCLNFSNKKNIIFLIFFFTPSLSLWTSVPSKELISVSLLIYICSCFTKLIYGKKISNIIFIISLLVVAFIRPNYFVIYGFFLMLVIFKNIFLDKITYKYNLYIKFYFYLIIYIISFLIIILTYVLFSYYFENTIIYIMDQTFHMFGAFEHMSSSMRNQNIEWNEAKNFYFSSFLGSFISFSGPAISDVYSRPIFILHFIESLIINIFIIYLVISMLNLNKTISNFPFLFLFGIMSCYFIGLIIHYPLGLFNIGSSLRYKQNLIPFFVIFPYLLINFKYKS